MFKNISSVCLFVFFFPSRFKKIGTLSSAAVLLQHAQMIRTVQLHCPITDMLMLGLSIANQSREFCYKAMLHEASFSCNLQRNDNDWKTLQVAEGVSHVRNILSHLATRPLEIVYNSFSASLKSLASERRALIASFSQNCFASCDWHVTRSNLSRNVAKS